MALTFTCLNGDSLVSVRGKVWEVSKIKTWGYHETAAKLCRAHFPFQQRIQEGDSGIWSDSSELKRENVVGKFIVSYFNYASMCRLKHGSH